MRRIRRWVDELTQDLRYAARTLRKSPGFAAVAVLSLTIGVGANAAIFSVVKAVLIEPLPYPHADRLAVLSAKDHVGASMSLSYPDVLDWKNQTQVFESLAGYQDYGFTVIRGDHSAERLPGRTVSANFFSTLGVVPSLGRDFAPADDRPGATPVTIVGHGVWQRLLQADPQIIGRSAILNGRSFTVIGVLPATFQFHVAGEIFAPLGLGLRPSARGQRRGIYAIGRLRPGMTFTQAQVEADTIAGGLARDYPGTNGDVGAMVVPLTTSVVGNTGRVVLILFAAVTFVLLIACANVANLLLARAAVRHKEIALRRALGAGHVRLVRQLLTESFLLAVLGGALGVGLTGWTIRGVNVLLPEEIRRLKHVEFDGWVLVFTLLLCLVSSLLFGLAPAWQMVWRHATGDISHRLNEGARGATSDSAHRSLRHLLVTSEVSLCVVLLIGGGLMIRTLIALDRVDPGFRPANLLHAQIVLPPAQYREDQQVAFFSLLLEHTRALPEVTAAALVMCAPLSGGCWASPIEIEGRPPAVPGGPEVNFNAITSGYFRTLGIPLLQGRDFDQRDRRDVPGRRHRQPELCAPLLHRSGPDWQTYPGADPRREPPVDDHRGCGGRRPPPGAGRARGARSIPAARSEPDQFHDAHGPRRGRRSHGARCDPSRDASARSRHTTTRTRHHGTSESERSVDASFARGPAGIVRGGRARARRRWNLRRDGLLSVAAHWRDRHSSSVGCAAVQRAVVDCASRHDPRVRRNPSRIRRYAWRRTHTDERTIWSQ